MCIHVYTRVTHFRPRGTKTAELGLIYKGWVHWGSPGYSSYSEMLEFPIEERPSNMNYLKYFRILIGITDRNYTIGYNFNIRQSSGTIDLSNVPDVYFGTPPYA